MEYIAIGILITLGTWFGGKVVDVMEPKKEIVEVRQEVLQCVVVETESEEIGINDISKNVEVQ
jgi:hypothetical protein